MLLENIYFIFYNTYIWLLGLTTCCWITTQVTLGAHKWGIVTFSLIYINCF